MIKFIRVVIAILMLFLVGCEEPSQYEIEQLDIHRFSQNLVYKAQFSDDLEQLLVIDEKRQIHLWQVNSRQKIFTLLPANTPEDLRATFFKKSENLLLLSGENHVDFWDLKHSVHIGTLKVQSDEPLAKISSINLSNYGGLVAVGMTDGTVFLFNRVSNSSTKKKVHDGTVNHIYFNSTDRYVVTTGTDGKVVRSSVNNLEKRYSKQLNTRISSLVIDEQSNRLFVSDVLDNQQIHKLDNGELLSKLSYTARFRWFRSGQFYDGGRLLITTTPKTDISLWNLSSGKEIFTWHSETLSLGSTNLDIKVLGKKAVTITSEGVYQKWSLRKK
ncbi:WD40 repeat domain-containing protein [Pseudoalteromonas sp. MTN2-4]|uniref:WD40 repeat domain-containing protein n=1 Tax=Pseudoalteromonas sp. MTN2-4 TaxID=3056555 RepID=UPI0036F2DAD8